MRIGIANDSVMAAAAMSRILAATQRHEIAWTASTGLEAVQRCLEDRPDLVLMDLRMPVMDGVEATRRIMAEAPCAILIVTATVNARTNDVFQALGAGALDAVSTPILGSDGNAPGAAAFLRKIDSISWIIGVGVRRAVAPPSDSPESRGATNGRLIAIGASAGGPAALATILAGLPRDLASPIVIVQHVDEEFAPLLATWLGEQSGLPVRVAKEGDRPQAGVPLIAGTKDHLVFKSAHQLGYTPEPRRHSYRPSVDVFFQSVVSHWHGDVVGVLLTGMGRDGAKGLEALKDAGFHTIAQNRESCVVYGMPKAAAELGAAVEILPLDQISRRLSNNPA